MCSIFLTNKQSFDLQTVNKYIKLRGPDHCEIFNQNGLTFIHNLLSISGSFTVQPFVDETVTAMFNGEIYNYLDFGNFNSDGECLVKVYKEHGALFSQKLDGEFAIILVDYKSRCVYLSTDIFLTKPLYVSFDNDGYFGVASYSSALTYAGFHDVNKLEANTIYKIDLDRPRLEKIGSVYAFSLRQYREDFDGWIEAFELAVKKRFLGCREKIFIGLSSGYDSGAICCALNKMGQPYNTYSVLGKENLDILNSRVALLPKGSIHRFIIPTHEVRERARNYINQYVEELNYVTYTSVGDYNEFNLKLHDDSGSTGLSMVCESAILDRCKVYLSGQGADEIISDYGFNGIRIYPHSNFGGLFPTDLESVFPWPSFYNSSQASYLMKEEHVAGSYGIEARYPFLDKRVVQEFLCLHPSLKNSTYKAPIRAYLEKNNFPTLFDHKIGF